jgi:hypothetical protein
MRVKIDAGGRVVEVETLSDANVTVESLGKEAQRLWEQTDGAQARPGPAYGFSAQLGPNQSRDQRAWMRYGEQVPVRAEESG